MIDEKVLIEAIMRDVIITTEEAFDLRNEIVELIKEQPQADKWIPIGQYPSGPSLLCFENGEMCVGHFDYDCDEWIISSGGEYETNLFEDEIEPIAWTNLPQPYKKEGAENGY